MLAGLGVLEVEEVFLRDGLLDISVDDVLLLVDGESVAHVICSENIKPVHEY